VDGNSSANTHQVDGCAVTPWFVKTSAAQDLEFARKLINSAKEGILFLFFNPGTFQQDPMQWTHNVKNQFHNWKNELLGASMVNIHSKVVILDPFGERPVVMTGSHHLGFKRPTQMTIISSLSKATLPWPLHTPSTLSRFSRLIAGTVTLKHIVQIRRPGTV
jgi:hypothetical protein